MFLGEFHHNLDNKGRIAIPAKFRPKLKEGAVITRGLDGCLSLYPKKEWIALAEKLATLPIAKANSRAFNRFILSGAMDVVLDKQGRIVIPEYLRSYALLKKEIITVGLFNKLEVWSKNQWVKYRSKTEKDSNAIAEKLGEMEGI